jgi:hypothetical protein
MAMKSSGGGGYGSRQHVEKPVRTGTGSHATTPGYVGQLGEKQGSHVTSHDDSNYRGEIMHRGGTLPTKFGNEVAANTVCGVGGSRTIYSAGSQSGSGGHGSANPGNPQPQQRDILSQYGPDYRRPQARNPGRSDTDADF